jgi:hypothetical protein
MAPNPAMTGKRDISTKRARNVMSSEKQVVVLESFFLFG